MSPLQQIPFPFFLELSFSILKATFLHHFLKTTTRKRERKESLVLLVVFRCGALFLSLARVVDDLERNDAVEQDAEDAGGEHERVCELLQRREDACRGAQRVERVRGERELAGTAEIGRAHV